MPIKKKIAWITDSTASLSKEFIKKYNVHVIPLKILFGHEEFNEGETITEKEFYLKLANSKDLPKTSQPSIGEFAQVYEKLKSEYDQAIAIHASSELTGTYQGSVSASQMVGFQGVEIIDSKIGSFPLGKMIQKGIELEEQGKSFHEITSYLKTLPDKARLYMIPGSLEQLHKGGRLTTTQTIFGQLIKLNLIIKFENGKAILANKVRTYRKAKDRIFDLFHEAHEKVKEVSVIHGNDQETANLWKNELQKLYPTIDVTTTVFSPVAGTHTGQGTIGLSWIYE